MADHAPLSFGIKTTPMHISYDDILAVWREADTIPEFEHAWLWDHMLPLAGDPAGAIYEGWTLLAALAAQTQRLRLGLMVTSNQIRPPAVLAKIGATTDVISQGRLEFGIGVGATRQTDPPTPALAPLVERAAREINAYGLTAAPPGEGVVRLGEACTIIKRLWSGDEFDFSGRYYTLSGAICRPVPLQQPHPPILIGGWGDRTLRVVAEHADIWNIPGPPHHSIAEVRDRSRRLDSQCATIGRDPKEITRSAQIIVASEEADQNRATILDLVDAGVTHLVLAPRPPYSAGVARRLADELIQPVTDQITVG